MKLIVRPSQLKGQIAIPASKSHTIRSVVIASLAGGESAISLANSINSLVIFPGAETTTTTSLPSSFVFITRRATF